jgi:hypothetical protein
MHLLDSVFDLQGVESELEATKFEFRQCSQTAYRGTNLSNTCPDVLRHATRFSTNTANTFPQIDHGCAHVFHRLKIFDQAVERGSVLGAKEYANGVQSLVDNIKIQTGPKEILFQ